MSDRPTLIVLRALGLGDLLTAVPALRAVATAFPHHRRLLLGPHTAAEVLELVPGPAPVVHGVVATDFTDAVGHIDPASPIRWLDGDDHPDDVQVTGPDVAVNLHGSGPASHRALQALAPGRLIAFAAPEVHHDGPAWDADEHEVRRWCRLLTESDIPADPTALRLDPPAVAPPSPAVGATVLHPGAAAPARRWPPERWVAVARDERAAGHRVAVTGAPSELPLARDIAKAAALPDDAVLAGQTSLRQLAAAVTAADVVVSGDTGVAHLATAVGTASVVLFGPTPPARWGPLINPERHIVLWAGRTGDPHGTVPDPGLLELTPYDVSTALRTLRSTGHGAAQATTAAPGTRSGDAG